MAAVYDNLINNLLIVKDNYKEKFSNLPW